jgi:hypothetical protein
MSYMMHRQGTVAGDTANRCCRPGRTKAHDDDVGSLICLLTLGSIDYLGTTFRRPRPFEFRRAHYRLDGQRRLGIQRSDGP